MIWLPRLRLALLILAVVVLQTTAFSAGLRVFGVVPDLGLVLTVAVAFYIGPERGAVFGFVSGLAVDLFLSTPLGLSALSFALVAYGVGVVQGRLVLSSRWVAPIMGALGGLAGGVLFVGVGALAGRDQLLALSSVRIILIASAYDALVRVRRVPDRAMGDPGAARRGPRLARASPVARESHATMGTRSFDLLGAKRGVIVIEGSRVRLTVIGVIVMFLFSALFARLWFLQVASDSNYAAAATSNRSRVVYEPALRGRILDRNGKPIVDNQPVDVVTFDRHKEMTSAERKLVVARVAQQLGVTADEIEKRIDDPRASPVTPVSIATGIPPEVRTYIEEHETSFPGVTVERTAVRAYPNGPLAANLIGYVSEINADELKAHEKEGYRKGDLIGKDGVEQTFEGVLRGRPRKLEVQVDSQGRVAADDRGPEGRGRQGRQAHHRRRRPAHGRAVAGRGDGRRARDPRPEREAAPAELPGRRRSRGRARSERRIGRRDGVEPHLRPTPVRHRHHARGVPAAQPAGEQLPAREPGRAGSVRAGVDVQALHRARGSPDRAARPERRASTTAGASASARRNGATREGPRTAP